MVIRPDFSGTIQMGTVAAPPPDDTDTDMMDSSGPASNLSIRPRFAPAE